MTKIFEELKANYDAREAWNKMIEESNLVNWLNSTYVEKKENKNG
jgi:hypothetical protein